MLVLYIDSSLLFSDPKKIYHEQLILILSFFFQINVKNSLILFSNVKVNVNININFKVFNQDCTGNVLPVLTH
jgi:hypothetical protein